MRKIRYTFILVLLVGCDSEPRAIDPEQTGGIGGTGGTGGSLTLPGTSGGAGGGGVNPPGTAGSSPAPVGTGGSAGAPPVPPRMDGQAPPAPGPDGGAPPPQTPDAGMPAAPFVPHPSAMSVAVYDETRIVDFYLTFPPGQWEVLLNPAMVEDDSRWAHCSFAFEGGSFPNARCRRKGDPMGWAMERKPQIIVRFNFDDKKGRFRGLRRINLESFAGTPAPIRDRLGMWGMREAGLDAPRVNHARVFKDGQLLGLYQNIEALDKEFLEDHYGPDAEGNLWDSGIELKTNETTPDPTRLQSLTSVATNEPLDGDHAQFFRWLPTVMDVNEVMLELAAETAITTDDNFSNGAFNFYYYEHPRRGFLVLPWDLDTVYNAPPTADVFAFWDENPPNKLRQLMNLNSDWRARFVDNLVSIRDSVLTRLPARVDYVCNQVAAAYEQDPNKHSTMDEFWAECAWFKTAVTDRIEGIRSQVGR